MKKIINLILFFIVIALSTTFCLANNMKFKDISTYKERHLIIYSVFTTSKDFKEMENYAKTKKGIDCSKFVYFFNDLKHTPDISKVGMDFDNKYNKYWIGGYFYYYGDKEKFIKYPGK